MYIVEETVTEQEYKQKETKKNENVERNSIVVKC